MAIHLDHAAGSPLDPRVREAMLEFLGETYASPAGLHDGARRPAQVLDEARAAVAALVGGPVEGVIFTAGATEARNLAVKGILAANRSLGTRAVTTAVEHPAVLSACRSMARDGGALAVVGVDGEGRVAAGDLAAAIDDRTALATIHHAQGEIGTVQDLGSLIGACREARPAVRVHVDAGDTAGLLPLDMGTIDADAVSLGGWPVGAPPWTGALVVRPGVRLHPLIEGGLQEAGKRAGAEDMAGIAALGAASRIAMAEMDGRAGRLRALGERMIAGLLAIPDVRLNGPRADRLPGNVQVSVGWVEGESLVLALATRGVACSPGSACTAHGGKAAPTLEAIGLEAPWTHSAVLFTLGPGTTADEVDAAVAIAAQEIARLRERSPIAP